MLEGIRNWIISDTKKGGCGGDILKWIALDWINLSHNMVAVKNLKSQFSSFEYPTFHVADHKQQLRTKILGKKYIKIFKRFRVLTSTVQARLF